MTVVSPSGKHIPYTERAEFVPEHTPTFTLDRQVAEARLLMGEAKWRALEAEWAE